MGVDYPTGAVGFARFFVFVLQTSQRRTIMKSQRNQDAVEEMERVIDEYPGGGSNPEAMRRLKDAAFSMEGLSAYGEEKLGSIEGNATILYSPRRHQRWDASGVSGTDRIRSFILADLMALRRLVRAD
jgi:hypothetical protein